MQLMDGSVTIPPNLVLRSLPLNVEMIELLKEEKEAALPVQIVPMTTQIQERQPDSFKKPAIKSETSDAKPISVKQSADSIYISLDSNNNEKPAIIEAVSREADLTPITQIGLHRGTSTFDNDLSPAAKTQNAAVIERHIDLDDEAAIKSANDFAAQILQAAANQDQDAVQNLADMMLKKFNIDDV